MASDGESLQKRSKVDIESILTDQVGQFYKLPKDGSIVIEEFKDIKNQIPFVPRRLTEQPSAKYRQVAVFTSDALDCISLFRLDINGQLRLLPTPTNQTEKYAFYNVQSFADKIFFRLNHEDAEYLYVGLFEVESSHDEGVGHFAFAKDIAAEDVLSKFSEESFCELTPFENKFADQLVATFVDANTELAGPFHYRCYRNIIDPEGPLRDIQLYLEGDQFRSQLQSFTGLSIAGVVSSDFSVIMPGDYQMFNNSFTEPNGLDVIINFVKGTAENVKQDGASWIYLYDGERVATVKPSHNIMSLAYRVEGCTRFMPYVCLESQFELYQLRLTFKVIDE